MATSLFVPSNTCYKSLNPWSAFQEQIKMIKLIEVHHRADFKISLTFSDGTEGIFDGNEFLKRNGPLLDALRNESYFKRAFIDAGALCWPNGLELSPTRLHQTCKALDPA